MKKMSLQSATEEESHHTSLLKVQLWLCRRVCREFQPAREIPRWPSQGPSEPTCGQSWRRHSWPSDFCSPGFGDKFKPWHEPKIQWFCSRATMLHWSINQSMFNFMSVRSKVMSLSLSLSLTHTHTHTHTYSIDIRSHPPPQKMQHWHLFYTYYISLYACLL